MKILIIGGTIFLGKHLLLEGVKRGHDISIFHRGKHNLGQLGTAQEILGDRRTDMEKVTHTQWDAVIDTCGYLPKEVRISAEALKTLTKQYTFISTESVYADDHLAGIEEDGRIVVLEDPTTQTVDGYTYGGLKALCEQKVQEMYPNNSLLIRPGFIVGPDDPSDRFTYWVVRANQKGNFTIPGSANAPMQFIDVRDLSNWIIQMIEEKATGIFNTNGLGAPLTFGEFMKKAVTTLGKGAEAVWLPEDFIMQQEEFDFNDYPLWVPDTKEYYSAHRFSSAKAMAHGLKFRPIEETIVDTANWFTQRENQEMRCGINEEKEKTFLQRYRNNQEPLS